MQLFTHCTSKIRPSTPSASARLIVLRPCFSRVSSFMSQQLNWLPFTARIEFKVLLLVLKSQLGSAPRHLCDHIRPSLQESFSLSVLFGLLIAMIFFFLVSG